MSWTGTRWIGAESRTTYGGYGIGSSRRRRRGTEEGPQSAEADAPLPRERSVQRAAGDGDQRWPQDGGGRRASRARGVGEGRVGHLASARRPPGGAPSPSSGCSSRRETENNADSEFPSSPIGRFKP